MDRVRVTNLMSFGVSAEDAGVHLPGKGDFCEVLTATADASKQLGELRSKRWVRVDPLPRPVRIWPFAVPVAVPVPLPEPVLPAPIPGPAAAEIASMRQEVARMTSLLEALISRPATAAPVTGIVVPAAPTEQAPIFIPTRVIPDAKVDIKIAEPVVQDKDVSSGAEALKNLRKRRS